MVIKWIMTMQRGIIPVNCHNSTGGGWNSVTWTCQIEFKLIEFKLKRRLLLGEDIRNWIVSLQQVE